MDKGVNHNYGVPSTEYVNQLSIKYNTNNLEDLSRSESVELLKSGVVRKFLKLKLGN